MSLLLALRTGGAGASGTLSGVSINAPRTRTLAGSAFVTRSPRADMATAGRTAITTVNATIRRAASQAFLARSTDSVATIPPTPVATYSTVYNTGTWPKTVSVTTAVGDVLVAAGSIDEWNSASDDFQTPTGGTGLTWLLKQFQQTTANCAVWVWTATASTAETFTFSISLNGGAAIGGATVTRWSGSAGIGNTSEGQAGPGSAPSLALNSGGNNSAIVAHYADWSETSPAGHTWRTINAITPASGSGELYAIDVASHAVFYGAVWSDAGPAGSDTTGLSTPTMKWTGVAVEVLGASAGGGAAGPAPAPVVTTWRASTRAGSALTLTPRTDTAVDARPQVLVTAGPARTQLGAAVFTTPRTDTTADPRPAVLVTAAGTTRAQPGAAATTAPRVEPYLDPPAPRPGAATPMLAPRIGQAVVAGSRADTAVVPDSPVPPVIVATPHTAPALPGAATAQRPTADPATDTPPTPVLQVAKTSAPPRLTPAATLTTPRVDPAADTPPAPATQVAKPSGARPSAPAAVLTTPRTDPTADNLPPTTQATTGRTATRTGQTTLARPTAQPPQPAPIITYTIAPTFTRTRVGSASITRSRSDFAAIVPITIGVDGAITGPSTGGNTTASTYDGDIGGATYDGAAAAGTNIDATTTTTGGVA